MKKQRVLEKIFSSPEELLAFLQELEDRENMNFLFDIKTTKSEDDSWIEELEASLAKLFDKSDLLYFRVKEWCPTHKSYHIIILPLSLPPCDFAGTEIKSTGEIADLIKKALDEDLGEDQDRDRFSFNLMLEEVATVEFWTDAIELELRVLFGPNFHFKKRAGWCEDHQCYHMDLKVTDFDSQRRPAIHIFISLGD